MENSEEKCSCGPWWFPDFLKKWLDKFFKSACKTHDGEYAKQEKSRCHCDSDFLNGALQLSKNKREVVLAYTMYFFVRFLGWTSWHRNKIKYFYNKESSDS